MNVKLNARLQCSECGYFAREPSCWNCGSETFTEVSIERDEPVIWGGELRAERKKLGMTQQEFAEAVGVSKPTVSKWELYKSKPYNDNLRKILELIDDE